MWRYTGDYSFLAFSRFTAEWDSQEQISDKKWELRNPSHFDILSTYLKMNMIDMLTNQT